MVVDRSEGFIWPDLQKNEAYELRDGMLRQIQQAGYDYQALMRPENQSSYSESETFFLEGPAQQLIGMWAVGAYGNASPLRYAVTWSWALLR